MRGYLCLEILAKCSIKLVEELTLDYQGDMIFSNSRAKCVCKSHACRGCLEKTKVSLVASSQTQSLSKSNKLDTKVNRELAGRVVKMRITRIIFFTSEKKFAHSIPA